MNGLLHLLLLTLRLNFRSRQAIIYGYVVPIFFLFAFGSVFRSGRPPLTPEMGQLLTVTVLGGACFGLPTAMVAERERGVWRRYRLLPAATGGIILSSMIARFVIVLSAAVLQIGLARGCYGTPLPAHPLDMLLAFVFVCFAFLGVGLVIAMLADNVPAVQAMGQAIFLPMIMIGGVGVPLRALPAWAQHVAGFLPGLYAVKSLQACQNGDGLAGGQFWLLALTIIGLAACVAGAKLFRWDIGQRIAPAAKVWVGAAVLAWAGVGLAAENLGLLKPVSGGGGPLIASLGTSAPAPASTPPATAASPTTDEAGPLVIAQKQPWEEITQAQINAITYDDVPDDNGTVVPLAADLNGLEPDIKKRLEDFADALDKWEPGKVSDISQRVRSYISACAVADIVQDPQEPQIPFIIFEHLKTTIPKDQLIHALAWVILKPEEGTVVEDIKSLGVEIGTYEQAVRERTPLYAKKFLFRLLAKEKPANP